MNSVVCFGEALIDFICDQKSVELKNGQTFTRFPGGAPANVAVGIARMGAGSAFVGKVGDDPFGRFLREYMVGQGVNVKNMVLDAGFKTSLAFVSRRADGERDFVFFREPGADTMIRESELSVDFLNRCAVFHFGSVSLAQNPVRDTCLSCVKQARARGVRVSFDPNVRLNLWPDANLVRETILGALPLCDVLKISEEELDFLAPSQSLAKALKNLHDLGPKIIFITLGGKGSLASVLGEISEVGGFEVDVEDTTGAGDAFMAGVLFRLGSLKDLMADCSDRKTVLEILRWGNAAGALVTTKPGAMSALPTLREVEAFLKKK